VTATFTPRRRARPVSDDQLPLVGLEPRRDDLTEAEIVAVEGCIEHDDRERIRHAQAAPVCRCGSRAWGDERERRCVRCGRNAT
jgi:hypothetical protein